ERLIRDYSESNDPIPLLLDLFTQALLAALAQVRQYGIFREYRNRCGDSSFPHGKLLFNPTMQRHVSRNANHRVTHSWFERTSDNGPNQILKYALWHLSQHYTSVRNSQAGARKTLRRLNEAYA